MKYFLLFICLIALVFSMFSRKANCILIVRKHISTMHNAKNPEKIYWLDIISFLVLPIVVSAIITFYFGYTIKFAGEIIAALSIFTALLFNFLMLIAGIKKPESLKKDDAIFFAVAKDTFINISFTILISFITIIFLLLVKIDISIYWLNKAISFCGMSTLIIFAFSLLLVLKRVFLLFQEHNGK